MNNLLLNKIQKSYDTVCAVNDFSLSILDNTRTAIIGPSGSGKTTLLRMIAGFESLDSGCIFFGNTLIADNKRSIPAYRREIGYVMQDGALFPHLRVSENIAFGLTGNNNICERRVRTLIERVKLDQTLLQRWPHELSGGQQQRVALARSLALQPRLMLLDEPFSSLDSELRASLRKIVIQSLLEDKITAVLVTHDQSEALSFAHQLVVMRNGRLIQTGSPAALYWHPVDIKTANFLGSAIILKANIIKDRAECILGTLPIYNVSKICSRNIMLRPEQIALDIVKSTKDNTSCIGIVIENEFSGPVCSLIVALEDNSILPVKCLSIDAPNLGSRVKILVKGQAHVLLEDV
ncbi:MAG: ABC transporter ATP-binding protein [Burkholderia sp.]|nr:ABC transporter ATP-binding protein [Burkholderia sp.]